MSSSLKRPGVPSAGGQQRAAPGFRKHGIRNHAGNPAAHGSSLTQVGKYIDLSSRQVFREARAYNSAVASILARQLLLGFELTPLHTAA